MHLICQCFCIGPLIDIALFLGIVAALAGAVGPLAVLLASIGMVALSLVVAYYASETGGAGAMAYPRSVVCARARLCSRRNESFHLPVRSRDPVSHSLA